MPDALPKIPIAHPIGEIEISTDRLLLRPLSADHQAGFVRMETVSAAEFARYAPSIQGEMAPDALFRRQLDRTRAGAASGQAVSLAACLKDRPTRPVAFVGLVTLNNIVRGVFQSADAGWRISTEFAGRGYGTEAVGGMLRLAFAPWPEGLELHRVQANIQVDNRASIRVAEKCGFRLEGTARRMLHIAGKWTDHQMFAKLSDDPLV